MHERQLEILRAIVEEYVATEEPVGSKVIAERHGLGVSPATIRNDMALLEDAGLIAQPHTSAGRIPTNSGYRVFVDKLAQVKPLSTPERRAIESFLSESHDLDDLLARTAKLLSQITKQVAVIQYPTNDRVVLAGTSNLARSRHEAAAELHPILEALEEQVVLLRLLSDVGDSINVKIGEEQPEKGLKKTSLVSMGYSTATVGNGAIGILGPTRMDYAGSMAAVNAVARYIGRFIDSGSEN
jgi:transcriptional regulator of heat shock response